MQEEDNNRLKKAFPPEYAHVADQAFKAQGYMKQIDLEIERLRRPEGPKGPMPLGGPGATTREARIAEHTKQKVQIAMNAWNEMEKELVEADPENAKIVRDNVRFMLDTENKELGKDDVTLENRGNLYQKQTQQEAKLRDKNFDYITSRVFNRKVYNAEKVKIISSSMEQGKEVSEKKEVPVKQSFSELYSRSLNYNINLNQDKSNKEIEKSSERFDNTVKNNPNNTEPGKDIVEDKEVPANHSFSSLYSRSLNYTINLNQEKSNKDMSDKRTNIEKPTDPSKDDV